MHGGLDTASRRKGLAVLGLDWVLEEAPEAVDVWPDAWAAVELFDALGSQWQVAPSGQLIGLRYEALPVVMDLHAIHGTERRRQMFDDMRTMESAVRAMINEQAKRGGR